MSAIDSSVPRYNGIAIASELIILYSTDALFFQATLISLWGMRRVAVYSILAFQTYPLQRRPHTQHILLYLLLHVPSMPVYALFCAPLFSIVWLLLFTHLLSFLKASRRKRAPSRDSGRRYDWLL
ncbi:hypothetical protein BKA82DRAFT_4095735 [Pisolithus tinctorius]|nr:hypothetical protein BKA82DRAFT_4095735 [Pisolithus tinctorius]